MEKLQLDKVAILFKPERVLVTLSWYIVKCFSNFIATKQMRILNENIYLIYNYKNFCILYISIYIYIFIYKYYMYI